MDIKKLSPWNWFPREEDHPAKSAAGGLAPRAQFTHPLAVWQQEMDRLLSEAFRNFGLPGFPESAAPSGWMKPNLDIAEDAEAYTVSLEVPGVEEKDIQINLLGDTLTIKGEKRKEEESKEKNFHRIERSYGAFQRVLTLPADADPEMVHASFKNGVLTLKIGKRSGAQAPAGKRIEISQNPK